MSELSIEQATFTYDGKTDIFSNLTCRIFTNEIFCILGPNGIGKSTLLKSLLNLYPLKSGVVKIDGKPIRDWKAKELARKIAYIPQSHNIAFPYRVLDMIMMGRTPHLQGMSNRPSAEDYDKVYNAAAELGIESLLYKTCTKLSGGQLQMVMLARAAAQEASFLMLDEPTAHLDFGKQMETLNLILKMKKRGMGVILTSHNPDHAFLVCDKVAIMSGGGFSAIGTPDEVVTEENLHAIYNIPIRISPVEGEPGRKMCVPLFKKLSE